MGGVSKTGGPWGPSQPPGTHLGHLDAPVEEQLGADGVAVLAHVVEEGAQGQQLCHQLQAGAGANAQQPHNVRVVQAADGQHVLRGQRQDPRDHTWVAGWGPCPPHPRPHPRLTSVTAWNDCCPLQSWITLMLTGILMESPSGIQMP